MIVEGDDDDDELIPSSDEDDDISSEDEPENAKNDEWNLQTDTIEAKETLLQVFDLPDEPSSDDDDNGISHVSSHHIIASPLDV
jgi:hypothetical protein